MLALTENEAFGSRLKRLRTERGWSSRYLEIVSKVPRSTISVLETGKRGRVRAPNAETLRRLAKAFGVTTDYMLYGEDRGQLPPGAFSTPPSRPVPILGVITAGIPIEAQESVEGYADVPLSVHGDLFYLRVRGDSMIPQIMPGDLVLVRKQETADEGQVVVAVVNDDSEATVKVLDKKGATVRLRAFNPVYQAITVPAKEVKILGIVLERRGPVRG